MWLSRFEFVAYLVQAFVDLFAQGFACAFHRCFCCFSGILSGAFQFLKLTFPLQFLVARDLPQLLFGYAHGHIDFTFVFARHNLSSSHAPV